MALLVDLAVEQDLKAEVMVILVQETLLPLLLLKVITAEQLQLTGLLEAVAVLVQ
jgi:hypothetical protein